MKEADCILKIFLGQNVPHLILAIVTTHWGRSECSPDYLAGFKRSCFSEKGKERGKQGEDVDGW